MDEISIESRKMIVQANSNIQVFTPLKVGREVSSITFSGQAEAEHNNHEHSTKPAAESQKDLEVQKQLQELSARDREVRAHEQAHAAAAGSLSKGGPSFEYQRGPDGKLYAVGGEVQIDTSGVPGDPEATLQKALQIQQAALAPSQPSAQDRAVAISAAAMAAEARAEIASQTQQDEPSSPKDENEINFQQASKKINDTYSVITDIGAQQSASIIDLVA